MFNYEGKTTGIKNLMYDEFIDLIPLNEVYSGETYPVAQVTILGKVCGKIRHL